MEEIFLNEKCWKNGIPYIEILDFSLYFSLYTKSIKPIARCTIETLSDFAFGKNVLNII